MTNKYTAAALRKAITSGMQPMRARPFQLLGDWAAQHFTFAGTSHSSGKWKSWPFQVGILNALADPAIKEVSLYKSKRVGGTKMLTAAIAYALTQGKKVCAWQPTDSDAQEFSADEIRPVIEDIRYLQQFRTQRTKSLEKNDYFPLLGASLRIRGGKASSEYRRLTLDVVLLDELDGFDKSVQGSGPPDVLAMGRLEGAPYPKAIFCSTPRLELGSHMARIAKRADAVLHWAITCPHCNLGHPLTWAPETEHGMHRIDGADVHICPHCRGSITQADFSRLTKKGFWWCELTHRTYGADEVWRDEAGNPTQTPERVVFRPWAGISPQRTWTSILDEYGQAVDAANTGDNGPMVLFTNETLGRTWSDAVERGDESQFAHRAEEFRLGTPPDRVALLTAGIDVQGDRVEVHVWGWNYRRECWTVAAEKLDVNPLVQDDWLRVKQFIQRSFTTEDGRILSIESISIDAGYHTEQVKTFVFECQQEGINIRAIKGSVGALDPFMGGASLQDVNYLGGRRQNGMRIWNVGHATSNDLIHGMLSLDAKEGPGVVHFAKDLNGPWYQQLNSEQKMQSINKKTGQVEFRWFTKFKRNEVRDCFRYALHAYMMLDAEKWPEHVWHNRITDSQRAVQQASPVRNELKSKSSDGNWLKSVNAQIPKRPNLNW
jgi:terminase, large subunit